MKAGNVPTARVAPIIADLIADRWPHGGGIDILSEKTRCDFSSIENVLTQQYDGVGFDLVDGLLCALGRPDIWRGELADIYLEMQFVETCAAPSCNKTFPERGANGCKQSYCSRKCQVLAANVRRGRGNGLRLRSKNRCLNGHPLTDENTVSWTAKDGSRSFRRCRTCKRAKDLESWHRRHGNQAVAA